ncbi:unnamed protein product [Vicia faba]|uniref:Uncharacterized protein n=1 Tax=Vicia faba TaxID=3906 RepID=A0AAV0ZZT6_VICFA|nr:unnamed protein product [Vicia faba]
MGHLNIQFQPDAPMYDWVDENLTGTSSTLSIGATPLDADIMVGKFSEWLVLSVPDENRICSSFDIFMSLFYSVDKVSKMHMFYRLAYAKVLTVEEQLLPLSSNMRTWDEEQPSPRGKASLKQTRFTKDDDFREVSPFIKILDIFSS